ncbi:hypothetical protein WJX79_002159 [Trebouxia sp. C0005]
MQRLCTQDTAACGEDDNVLGRGGVWLVPPCFYQGSTWGPAEPALMRWPLVNHNIKQVCSKSIGHAEAVRRTRSRLSAGIAGI